MRTSKYLAIGLIGLSLCMAVAQDNDAAPPVPLGITQDNAPPPADESKPDTRPLTGIQPFGLGSLGAQRSFVQPNVYLFEQASSNLGSGGGTYVDSVTTLNWDLGLQHVGRTEQTGLRYAGGYSFRPGQSQFNGVFHQFGGSELFQFRRWSLMLNDQFSYYPESPFGYAFGPGLTGTLAGVGLPGYGGGLNQNLIPNQTILTGASTHIGNVIGAQVDVLLGPRSSLTLGGSYGLLRFPKDSAIDSDQWSAQLGYNYAVGARDTIGVSYNASRIMFEGGAAGRTVFNQSAMLAYGRRLTGRLGWRLMAGPQISTFENPPFGSSRWTSWVAASNLTYKMRRAALAVNYSHFVSGGSGILTGASSDVIQGSITPNIFRTLQAVFGAGYARNASLQQLSLLAVSTTFNSEFVNAGLSHPLGQRFTMNFNYSLQRQATETSVCVVGGICAGSGTQHVFGVGFGWHPRPMLIAR